MKTTFFILFAAGFLLEVFGQKLCPCPKPGHFSTVSIQPHHRKCLRFNYKIKTTERNLTVFIEAGEIRNAIWDDSYDNRLWKNATIEVSESRQKYKFVFEGVAHAEHHGVIAVKDISIHDGGCFAVDGNWGGWEPWSNCPVTCGGGEQTRIRKCDSPAPADGGRECDGLATESRNCSTNPCSVDGGWSNWNPWSPCPVTCGGGEQIRTRVCDSPPKVGDGRDCEGDSVENRTCGDTQCPVNGYFNNWEPWTVCTVTCGGGTRVRNRTCNGPFYNGSPCVGPTQEQEVCNDNACPPPCTNRTTNKVDILLVYSSSDAFSQRTWEDLAVFSSNMTRTFDLPDTRIGGVEYAESPGLGFPLTLYRSQNGTYTFHNEFAESSLKNRLNSFKTVGRPNLASAISYVRAQASSMMGRRNVPLCVILFSDGEAIDAISGNLAFHASELRKTALHVLAVKVTSAADASDRMEHLRAVTGNDANILSMADPATISKIDDIVQNVEVCEETGFPPQ